MSIIAKSFTRNGVLTDADGGITLSDITGTFGVKRNDTDAVIVADGTAMTNVGTGLYQHEFVDPAQDLIYTYAFEIVHNSQTIHLEDVVPGPATADIGYTVAELLTRLTAARGLASSSTAQDTESYQAITAAGRAAATWRGSPWWWQEAVGSFSTVVSTSTYALRSINNSDMSNLWSVQRAYWDDDWPLANINYRDMQMRRRILQPTGSNSDSFEYAISRNPPTLYLNPPPNTSSTTIFVDYISRHPQIDVSAFNSDLIVPAEFQDGVYLAGAMWFMRNDVGPAPNLEDCPGFVEAMRRMAASDPTQYDDRPENRFSDASVGSLPNNRIVLGGLIGNSVSL